MKQSGCTNLVWHYTTEARRTAIIASGLLRISGLRVMDPAGNVSEIGWELWFSSEQLWEPTVQFGMKMAQVDRFWGGLLRFGVDSERAQLLSFEEYIASGHITSAFGHALVESAARVGADPRKWWVSLTSIPREQWVSIQIWNRSSKRWLDDRRA